MSDRETKARGTGRSLSNWLAGQFRARPRPLWLLCACHVLALGLALVLYALPHHVIPHGEKAVGVVSNRNGIAKTPLSDSAGDRQEAAGEDEGALQVAAATQAPNDLTDDEDATAQAAPVVEDEEKLEAMFGVAAVGNFRKTFGDRFTSGEVERTENSYRSANVCVTIENRFIDEMDASVYVADIYVADISCLTTAFSQDTYGRGYTEWVTDIAARYDSVVTMNGDYYGSRSTGVIIRNGELYRDNKHKGDICVLYWDGHMETFKSSKFNTLDEMDRGAYQSWSFGPSLLDESGKPLDDFNCDNYLRNRHPRSAIGYFEPGHYCFVVVDGRSDDSKGSTLTNLATILSRLGCKVGYNLDGGQTSLLAAGTTLINHPSQGGRDSSDYIMIVDRIIQ